MLSPLPTPPRLEAAGLRTLPRRAEQDATMPDLAYATLANPPFRGDSMPSGMVWGEGS
jgi:hypothetical protein